MPGRQYIIGVGGGPAYEETGLALAMRPSRTLALATNWSVAIEAELDLIN